MRTKAPQSHTTGPKQTMRARGQDAATRVAVAPRPASGGFLQLQTSVGNQATLELLTKGVVQPKLRIGAPDDPSEREADRVADHVMQGATSIPTVTSSPSVQRMCADCEDEVQRMSVATPNAPALGAEAPAIVQNTLDSSGAPLDRGTRTLMEQRFGRDFQHVRVHTDARAAESARSVRSYAYTVGSHIVFDSGQYSPQSPGGQRLLSHELAHVVQQRAAGAMQLQRSLEGCRDLLANPTTATLLSGSLVHRLIAAHFLATVQGARQVAIPGASAGALRSQGLCGEDDTVIPPQLVGGRAGMGFPDLARITSGRILQVAEIKPAAIPCLIDGEEQMLRYINQGNAQDAEQIAWRASMGVIVVSPMLPSAYTPPRIVVSLPSVGTVEVRTAWCSAGLIAYTVQPRGQFQPVPRRVTQSERSQARERLRQRSPGDLAPVAAAAAVATAVVVGKARWPHCWKVVIKRFAVRGAAALLLSAADGPLPFGELISLGLAVLTVIDIVNAWDELWREADQVAAQEA